MRSNFVSALLFKMSTGEGVFISALQNRKMIAFLMAALILGWVAEWIERPLLLL